jgi:hypothetical protein
MQEKSTSFVRACPKATSRPRYSHPRQCHPPRRSLGSTELLQLGCGAKEVPETKRRLLLQSPRLALASQRGALQLWPRPHAADSMDTAVCVP